MTKTPTNWKPRRVPRRNQPNQISPEEKANLDAEREASYQKARAIFDKVRPQLINNHYNWYITIEPNTGEYFLSQDDLEILHKLQQEKPHLMGKVTTFRLNETGTCGSI